MAKWLAAATVVVFALLAFLWIQIREPAAAVQPTKRAIAAAPAAEPPPPEGARELAAAAQKVREAEARGDKIDPASDAMIYHLDEQVPPRLTMEAAKCYSGGLHRVHRNDSVRLGFNIKIKDGVVTVHDVKVLDSKITDKVLVDCFVREVAKVSWQDDQLPDWQQDDELVISPERGMKKFTKENLAYEGDGPIGTLEAPVGHVAASREAPKDLPAREELP